MVSLRIPAPDDFSQQYWDAAREGRLLFQECGACRARQFYPRAHCARCLEPDPEWRTAAGPGNIYSFTTVHRTPNSEWATHTPYVFALVDLDEGVRITCNIKADDAELNCGDRVHIEFTEREGFSMPTARLA